MERNPAALVQKKPSKPQSFGRLRTVLMSLVLIPFVFAIAVHWIGVEPAPVAGAPDRPALAFRQYLVDLGKVPPSPIVGARFQFVNRGSSPVKIDKLIPSCGCLSPRLAKRIFQPGEKGEIVLPVQTPNEVAGPREYTVRVQYSDPEPRETTLTFRVTLPEKMVLVRPRALFFYQFGKNMVSREIVVTDLPRTGLSITEIECSSEFLDVERMSSRKDEFGNPQHVIKVTSLANVPPGRHRTTIVIHTDHSRYSTLRVPIIIQGPENPGRK
ncbi:MAG: hypothetical protein Tsb009_09190 [Planctomycetaceae bacterium]